MAHRTAHRVRWFWASHVIHHSSTHYNLSTALRQTWTGFFSLTFLFRMPLFFIGFPVEMVLFVGGAMNLAWMVFFTLVVLGEKTLPTLWRFDRAVGATLIASGLWVTASAWAGT